MRPSSCLFLVALMAVTKRALGCTLNTDCAAGQWCGTPAGGGADTCLDTECDFNLAREKVCPDGVCITCTQNIFSCSASCNKCGVTGRTCDTCAKAVCNDAEDACSAGESCDADTDCGSEICRGGMCCEEGGCADGLKCDTDSDCGDVTVISAVSGVRTRAKRCRGGDYNRYNSGLCLAAAAGDDCASECFNAHVLSSCGAELAACGTDASSPGTCMSFGGCELIDINNECLSACGVSGCISKLVAELIDDYFNYYPTATQMKERGKGNIGFRSPEYQAISACYREANCSPESDEEDAASVSAASGAAVVGLLAAFFFF